MSPPVVIARFEHVTGVSVDVVRGDVRDIDADILILGRSRRLRQELLGEDLAWEQASDSRLEPMPIAPRPVWSSLAGRGLPWRHAAVIRRRVGKYARPAPDEYAFRNEQGLVSDIGETITAAETRLGAGSALLMGLSVRESEMSALVASAAVVAHLHLEASQRLLIPAYTCGALPRKSSLPLPEPSADSFEARRRARAEKEHAIRRFVLASLVNPEPFVRFLSNEKQGLIRARLISSVQWRLAPLRRVG